MFEENSLKRMIAVCLAFIFLNASARAQTAHAVWAVSGGMKTLLTVVLFTAACAALGLTVIATQSPPKITRPVMFDTPEADRILAALQVFPPDNPWNQDISTLPVRANSAAIIASIGNDKHIDF